MMRLVRAAILSAALAAAVLPEPAAASDGWEPQNPKIGEVWRQRRVRSRAITSAVVVYVLICVGRMYYGWRRRQVDFKRENNP